MYDQETHLTVKLATASTVEYTGGSETDIIYKQGTRNVPQKLVAVTWCNDAVFNWFNPSRVCDQHYVKSRSSSMSLNTACHETGHAIGLTHPTEATPAYSANDARFGCMNNAGGFTTNLDPHQVKEIDATY